MSFPKLLIVNFNKTDRDKIANSLSNTDFMHTMQAAADATDALEFIKKKNFGLILFNSRKKADTALEFILQLKLHKKSVPLLVITDSADHASFKKLNYHAPLEFLSPKKIASTKFDELIDRIIERKNKAELSAKETAIINENRYKVLFENTQGFICTHSMTGDILSINKAAAKILGFKAQDLIGRNLHDFLVEEKKDMFVDYLKELNEKKKSTGIMQFMSKDNEKRYLVYRNVVHQEPGSDPYVIASSQDITDIFLIEKQLESANRISELNINRLHKTLIELDKAKKIAEESVRIKQEFLANMSHEIRTPMNAIIGFASLLEKSSLNNEQTDYLAAIKTSGENLLVIINDILDFSKIDAGMMSIENTQFDIDLAINNVINQFLPKIREKNLLLKTSFNFKRNLNVIGDQVRLHQVLSNLISNAIKFTDKGGITISVNQKKETSQYLLLEFIVSDTGIGIPQDKTETIFESFTQASPETTRKYGGTGLGLAIVKKLLELQNGSITLKSHLNVGTTFTFSIPYLKTLTVGLSNKKEKQSAVHNLNGLRLLVAEDNLLNQKLVVKLLEDLNCTVDVVQNGLEAIEKLQQHNYHLIFMDIQMPEMDGLQATKVIREQLNLKVPIIALTAHTFKDEEDKCRASGMSDFLSKPFTSNDLYKVIIANVDKQLLQSDRPNRIDLKLLTHLADGNTDFMIKMLEIYAKQTPENLNLMDEFLAENKFIELAAIAHKMRSSVPYVGLHEAEKLLEKLEYEAKEKIQTELFPERIKLIRKLCEESLTQVKEQLYLLSEKSLKQ